MAHFAEIETSQDEDEINCEVIRVIVVANEEILNSHGEEEEELGASFCRSLFGGTWVQTSYNGNFRKRFAGKNFIYNRQLDAFIPPKPYDSWLLNEDTCLWEAPVALPDSENEYTWDEDTVSWIIATEE